VSVPRKFPRLLSEVVARIRVLKEEYGFSENDEIDDSWGAAQQRGYGRLCELIWIRDQLKGLK